MSNGKKVLVALMRAFFGVFGVDCFIMKNVGVAVGRIVVTVALCVLPFIAGLFNFIPSIGEIVYWVCIILIAGYALVREVALFVGGLLMLRKTPEEVAAKY